MAPSQEFSIYIATEIVICTYYVYMIGCMYARTATDAHTHTLHALHTYILHTNTPLTRNTL